jgi:DNA-3-methyladenine glycosylase II
MATTSEIAIHGPFSLDTVLAFLEGFPPAGLSGQRMGYRGAHVLGGAVALVSVWQSAAERLAVSVEPEPLEPGAIDAAVELVRRIFSLDLDAQAFAEVVGRADPVIAGLLARYPGLRPVLFGSPFESLCWAIVSQRISLRQAARLRAGLVSAYGPRVTVDGQTWRAFPAPEHLVALDPEQDGKMLRLPAVKVERLQRLAQRGAAGELDAERLLAMPEREARAWLEESPGIGTWASEFALIRGAGHPDLIPRRERRLTAAVRWAYGLDHEPDDAEIRAIGERWAPFRSWATFLLRVAWGAAHASDEPGPVRR